MIYPDDVIKFIITSYDKHISYPTHIDNMIFVGYYCFEVRMMNVIESMLLEEKERNLDMQRSYIDEINDLPKGSVTVKKIGNKEYCYLKFRQGEKFISKYMGIASENAEQLSKQIEKRRHFEKLLRELKVEYKMISKIVKD